MTSIAAITGKYINRPFREIGCLDLVYKVITDLNLDIPNKVGQWGVDNYKELVEQDLKYSWEVMINSFKTIGQEISLTEPKIIGDLMVIQSFNQTYYPAVYVGKNCGMASFIEIGVQVFDLDEKNKPFMIRRFLNG